MIAAHARALVIIATVLITIRGSVGVRLFVSPEGHDTHGDGSEERPFKTVQAAIDTAWDFDVIILTDGVHSSDTEIRFERRKLSLRAQHGPNTRSGGCWPVHTGDIETPTLTRCNVTSWPQKWDSVRDGDDDAWATQATSVQTLPESLTDVGRDALGFHGSSKRPIPASGKFGLFFLRFHPMVSHNGPLSLLPTKIPLLRHAHSHITRLGHICPYICP